MRAATLFATLLVVTYNIAISEGTFLVAALALGGLAALKGAAIVGYAAGRHRRHYRPHYHSHGRSYGGGHGHHGHGYHGSYRVSYRHGRSVENSPAEEGEDMLLSTVSQVDPNGCVLKLLCHLQIKEESTRTIEENVLVDMFANSTESFSAYNAAFVYATDLGRKTQDIKACKKYFPNCPLNGDQLSGLLQQAWGCGFNFFDEEEEEETIVEQEEVVEEEVTTPAPTEISLVELMSQNVSN